MRFGEPVDDDRLMALLRPGGGIDTVMTADAYGAGEADELLGRALAGVAREDYCLVGAIGHDFYEGERDGAKGFPRFTDPRLRGPDGYADYVRMATERSLERCGADAFDLLLLHNPDRIGYTSETVWDALEAVRGRRAGRRARRRTRPRQRLHARPDRLLRALRRADRLGDGDPQPARAVAGRAGARRRPPPRRAPDHARRRLRRPVPRRRAARPSVPALGPPLVPPAGLGRARARADGPHAADRRAPRPDHAAARVRVEPGPRAGGLRRPHADPGAGRRTRGRSRTSAPSWRPCRARS